MSSSIDVYRAFREANVSEENAQKAAQAIAPAAEGFARLEQLILTSEARLQNMITASETRLRTEIAASEARLRTDINSIDIKVARLSGEMV